MIQVQELKRKFTVKIEGKIIELEDPNPNFEPKDIMELYSTQYPQLLNATVESKGIENEALIYHFATVAGTKG